MADEETFGEEEVFPGEQREHEFGERIQRMIEQHGRTNNASIMATSHLLDRVGEVLTPLELGQKVYEGSEELKHLRPEYAEHLMHTRILSLLNDKTSRVPTMLEQEGYRLLYGDRYHVTASGKRVGNARRVYMVTPIEDTAYPTGTFVEESSEKLPSVILSQPSHKISRTSSDAETESNTTESDLDAIEQTVEAITKHDKWTQRIEHLVEQASQLLPWLDDNGLMPSKAGGRVNAMRLRTKLLNKDCAETAPVTIVDEVPSLQSGHHLTFKEIVHTLTPSETLSNMPAKYAREARRKLDELEYSHFEPAKEQE